MAVRAGHRLPQPSCGGGPQSTLPAPLVHDPRQCAQQQMVDRLPGRLAGAASPGGSPALVAAPHRLLSVCPGLIICFCNCVCPLLEGPNQIRLNETISTRHRLP